MVTENRIVLKRGYIDGFCRQSFIRDLQIKEEYDAPDAVYLMFPGKT